jgi:DNA-binding NtrC family response regulator
MPLAAQARLLRVLQEKRVTPIGADKPVDVDVRVLAATHKNLEDMVEAQTFREDLYYRLSVIPIHLPALRNRTEDVVPLAHALLAHHNRQSGKPPIVLGADAETALKAHGWPGNVRELAHTIERACLLARNGRITAETLGGPMRRLGRSAAPARVVVGASGPSVRLVEGESLNLKAALDNIERDLIHRALERTAGNRTEAAALLGLNRTTLVEKLRKLD